MLTEIGIILLLILINGLLAGTELALVSARATRLQQLADQGSRGAQAAVELREDPDPFLSAVQVSISLITTLMGVFAGVSLVPLVSTWLAQVSVLEPYASGLAFFLVVVGIACSWLVLGEQVPRRLAVQRAEGIAARTARLMQALLVLCRPLIVVLSSITSLLLTLLGHRRVEESSVTEEDIRELVREGAQEGSVDPQEEQVIEGVFTLGERSVRQIMTPRVDVSALDSSARIADVLDEVIEIGYSRFPVYENSLDDIVGVTHVRTLLQHYRQQGEQSLVRDAMYPATIVPEHARASSLLSIFRKNQRHLAVVVSELGSVEGVVTLEDVLEEIVGDILDESDEIEAQAITVREDGSLLIEGGLPINLLKKRLNVEELPDEEFFQYDTLAGFLLSMIGRIPQAGDSTRWNEWRFEVVDMDGLRIDKVLVQQEEPEPEHHEESPSA